VNKSNEKEKIKVSKVEIDGRLYEELYDTETGEAKFVFYDEKNKAVKETPYVDDGDTRYAPCVDKFVKIEAVMLPSEALSYESEEKLLLDIQSFIHKYIDISSEDEQICTWTIPMFWLYDKLKIMIPYLRALGDTGCGKSRFLDVIGGISYKTMMMGGSITPAIMYRVAEKWRGTMIIDEADWKNTDEYSEVIKIINCNQPNRRILRCKGDNYDDIQVFDPWCPRIFATRHQFSDVATESRMLTIQMKETSRDDIPIGLNDEFYEEQNRLRNQLLTYRLNNWHKVNANIKPEIDLKGIEPRGRQIMNPIAIVFNHNKEILKQFREIMMERQGELIKERSSTYDGIIVNTYLELHHKGRKLITASDIVDIVKIRGCEKATTRSVGHHMRSLGFKNSVKNIKGVSKRCYSCDETLLKKLRKRYSLNTIENKSDEKQELQRLQRLQKYGGWPWIGNTFKKTMNQ